jgi:hypothetical protein
MPKTLFAFRDATYYVNEFTTRFTHNITSPTEAKQTWQLNAVSFHWNENYKHKHNVTISHYC